MTFIENLNRGEKEDVTEPLLTIKINIEIIPIKLTKGSRS